MTGLNFVFLIFDLDQVKSFGGSGRTGSAAVARLKNFRHRERCDASLPDEEKSTHQVANHVVKESVASNDVEQLVGVVFESRLGNSADVRDLGLFPGGIGDAHRAVGIDGCEGGEVVPSDDKGGSLLHGLLVQWVRMVGNVAGQEGRNNIAAPYPIVVTLASRGVPRMEAYLDFIDCQDSNGGGKAVIEHGAKVGDRYGTAGFKTYDLRQCMNARIGASGALWQKLFPREALDHRCQRALNGGPAGLDLPSVEGGAVIGERKFERSCVQGIPRLLSFMCKVK